MAKQFTTTEIMALWAARISGGTLKTVIPNHYTEQESGLDEAAIMMRYVENTAGYAKAKPALLWVYVYGKEPSAYNVRKIQVNCGYEYAPSYDDGLLRHGWQMHDALPKNEVCRFVIDEFDSSLAERLLKDPPMIKGPRIIREVQ